MDRPPETIVKILKDASSAVVGNLITSYALWYTLGVVILVISSQTMLVCFC